MRGVLGWSAVVNSGATLLGPLQADDLQLYHDLSLPTATWSAAENAAVVPADIKERQIVQVTAPAVTQAVNAHCGVRALVQAFKSSGI